MSDTLLTLGFDTAGPYCAAALLSGDEVLEIRADDMARGQAEHLIGMLEAMLSAHSVTWSDLTSIGVGIGPGNFTGIRIAVSAARGLALGLGIPAIGVSAFDTTQRLSQSARTAVPAPRDRLYFLDASTRQQPVLIPAHDGAEAVLSTVYSPSEHVCMIAQIAAERAGPTAMPPRPLYVKSPDAAPAKDAPPTIVP